MQYRAQIQILLTGSLAGQDLQQIDTTDQLLQAANTELCQPVAGFLCHEAEKIHRHLDSADVMVVTQVLILGSHAGGAVVEMADTQIFTAQSDHWRRAKPETLGTENSGFDRDRF